VTSSDIDDIDREILNVLIQKGRATYKQLGERTRLSPHAVAPRVRRLVEAGIITGFTTSIDYGAVGRGLDALIDIRLLSTVSPESFEATVAALPSARELSFLTGRFDYQLRAACIDADDLDQTVRALRKAGAGATETRIVLRTRPFQHQVRKPSERQTAVDSRRQ
jgi:Lrp/AsnC family transcriptional regulator, leucine-responsive regulatory protein